MKARDLIRLSGMEFYAYHGVAAEEQRLGQRFVLDLELYGDWRGAGISDEVTDTVNYAAVYQTVRQCVLGEKYRLLERLAAVIVRALFDQFPCTAIRLAVHKPQAPVPGVWRDISVEIFRERADMDIDMDEGAAR
ncbi:MAG: dihydroneopterin aldolase [Peptococcaceae bacterium]|jgi:dihydroneopterin aldolase|nr:dihydroneopterin aldolase [Peptococcaceae bacterium]